MCIKPQNYFARGETIMSSELSRKGGMDTYAYIHGVGALMRAQPALSLVSFYTICISQRVGTGSFAMSPLIANGFTTRIVDLWA